MREFGEGSAGHQERILIVLFIQHSLELPHAFSRYHLLLPVPRTTAPTSTHFSWITRILIGCGLYQEQATPTKTERGIGIAKFRQH